MPSSPGRADHSTAADPASDPAPSRLLDLPDWARICVNLRRRSLWGLSAAALLLSLLGMTLCWVNPAIKAPLRLGLDFTGGTQLQIVRQCASDCSGLTVSQLQGRLNQLDLPDDGAQRAPSLAAAAVQLLDQGKTVLLRLPTLSPAQSQAISTDLEPLLGGIAAGGISIDTIGPTLGVQLLQTSLVSLLVSFVGIALYISVRYDRIFAFLALLCLAHDVLITCGVFAWLGLLAGVEVDSLFAVALITVAGYSVNDTVVVFDRIREQKAALSGLSMAEQVDVAVDATLTRSLYTSFTTLLPLLGLIFFGGASLYWFAVALALGIVAGSWSSIGVAPTLLPLFSRR